MQINTKSRFVSCSSNVKDGESGICQIKWRTLQEIHQIWHWNELERNFYLVLITVKGVLTFFISQKHKEQTNIRVKLVWSSFQYQVQRFSYLENFKTLIWF